MHGQRALVTWYDGKPLTQIKTRKQLYPNDGKTNLFCETCYRLHDSQGYGYFYAISTVTTEEAHALLDQFLDAVNR